MPIEVSHVTSHLYLNVASGVAKMEDIGGALQEMERLATQNGEEFYVIVSDATDVKNIPFDLKALRRLVERDRRVVAILFVKPTYLVNVAVNILSRVSPMIMQPYPTRDAALQRAHQIIADKAQEQEKAKS